MWTVWNGAQQMVNSRTMVTIILTALFFFLLEVKTKEYRKADGPADMLTCYSRCKTNDGTLL